ncbi:MAG: alpha/beta hydrolase [bacterium]
MLSLVIAALIALAIPDRSGIALADARVPANVSQTDTFNVGMLHVERTGQRGRTAIIFIPGLFCGPWVWQREIAALSDRYDVYALTLPGFDGRPRDAGADLMNRAVASLSDLISTRKLDHPIVVGHSLGGTLAVMFGEKHANQVSAIITAEGGYPEAATAEERQKQVAQNVARYRGLTRETFAPALKENMLQYVITSKVMVDSVERLATLADPAATMEWLEAALSLDLTPGLSSITVPLTAIIPFDSVIDPYQGFKKEADKRDAYTTWLAHAPTHSLVMIHNSRHFEMIDQPEAFDRALYAAIESARAQH